MDLSKTIAGVIGLLPLGYLTISAFREWFGYKPFPLWRDNDGRLIY